MGVGEAENKVLNQILWSTDMRQTRGTHLFLGTEQVLRIIKYVDLAISINDEFLKFVL